MDEGIKDITPRRATSDIDFAILIKDSKNFEELKHYLVTVEGFTPSRENAFVLIAPDRRQIDILPFGEIEKKGKVSVKGTGITTIYVDGMKEVYEEGIPEVTFEKEITFKVCTLPGIVLLKFIAWDDRPEMRSEDLIDIADIISHFFTIYDEMIWSEHNDLFEENRDLENISARVLGREMGKILNRNPVLKNRFLGILTDDSKSLTIATVIAQTLDRPIYKILSLLNDIVEGIQEIK